MIRHTIYVCIFLSFCAGLPLQVNADSGNSEKHIVDVIGYMANKENEASLNHVDTNFYNGARYNGYVSRQRVKRSRTYIVRQGLLFAKGLLARKKILKGAKFTRTAGKITHYEKSGGYSQMKADFRYAAKRSKAQISVGDGTFQGSVDFGDMTIQYVGNKALPGKTTDEPVLKILLKDKNGEVFRENWVHYKYIDNVD